MSKTENIMTSNAHRVDMHGLDLILDFTLKSRLPIVIWGNKAVGKTSRVHQIAEERGYRLEVLHLATQDIVDLIGMMAKVPEDEDQMYIAKTYEDVLNGKDLSVSEIETIKTLIRNPKMKTAWMRPQWLHNDPKIKTIYFLDEMNRANKFVSAAMLPFLLEGKMHQHSMGPNDVVIAACNPSTGKYAVNDAFAHDEALKDRCGHVILEPTNAEYLKYAKPKLDDITWKVLSKHQSYIEIGKFDLSFKIEPSRRSLLNVMSIIGKESNTWIRKYGKDVIGCYLGTDFLKVWWDNKFKNDNYLEITELIEFELNKKKITEAILGIVDGVETVRNDVYEASLDTIINWFSKDYKDGSARLDWLTKYFSIPFIPKDSIVGMLSKIDILSNPQLAEHFYDSGLLDQIPEIAECNKFQTLSKGK